MRLHRLPWRSLLSFWAKVERGTLVAVGVGAIGLFAFWSIAEEVLEGETHAFDEAATELSWLRYDRDLAAASVARFGRFLAEVLGRA